MPTREKKTYAKSYSTTDQTEQQLAEIAEKHNLLSNSEAMRRSVAEFHRATFPDYIYKKSAKDIKAREAVTTEKKMENLEPIKFAEEYIGNFVELPGKDGHQWIILWGMSNYLTAVRDDEIKSYFKNQSDMVELHKKKVESKTVEEALDNYMIKYLSNQYGIIFPTDETQTNTNEEKESERNE